MRHKLRFRSGATFWMCVWGIMSVVYLTLAIRAFGADKWTDAFWWSVSTVCSLVVVVMVHRFR